jgi:hypothetical protein
MSSGHSRRVRTTHHRPRYTAPPSRGYDSLHAILRMIRDRLPELPKKADSGEYTVVTDVIEWRSQVRHGRNRFLEGRSWLTVIATGRHWIAVTPSIPRRSARSRSAMMRWDDQSPRTALRHCRRLNGERRRGTGNSIRIAAAEDGDRDPPVGERRAMSGETQASRGSRRRDEGADFQADVLLPRDGDNRVRVCKVPHCSHDLFFFRVLGGAVVFRCAR